MTDNNHYTAILAQGSAVPTLLCGHCHSILSRARIFRNQGDAHQAIECNTIGLLGGHLSVSAKLCRTHSDIGAEVPVFCSVPCSAYRTLPRCHFRFCFLVR